MERSEPATLAEELQKAPLPVPDVLRRALDLAVAVNRLHRKGRVHGRIEPALIQVTPAGIQLLEAPAGPGSVTPYTAPEQLRGEFNQRADIFAFGAVIYGMAAGLRAFPGDSEAELRDAILHSQPAPLMRVVPGAASPAYAELDRVIFDCLVKNPDQRRQRMQNVLADLKLIAASAARPVLRKTAPGSGSVEPPQPPARSIAAEAPADRPDTGIAERRAALILNQAGFEPGYMSQPANRKHNLFRSSEGEEGAAAGEESSEEVADAPVSEKAASKTHRPGWTMQGVAITLVIVALVGLSMVAAFALYRSVSAGGGFHLPSIAGLGKGASPAGKMTFALPAPDRASYMSSPAISPDGRLLAFSAVNSDKKRLLWIRRIESLSATPLEGTEDALAPFWSPDSKQVGFFAGNHLKKVAADGGSPVTLCETGGLGGGGTWSQEGVIVFGRGFFDALYQVSADGGAPQATTRLDSARGERAHLWPRFLPDGRHFLLYALAEKEDNNGVSLGSLDNKETRHLLSAETNAIYAEPPANGNLSGGYLLYAHGRRLIAQPFDTSALAVKGEPFTVADQITYLGFINLLPISASSNGLLVYQNIDAPKRQLVWFDREGNQVGSLGEPSEYGQPRISPNGKVVAVNRLSPQNDSADIWLFDLDSNTASQFTSEPTHEGAPVWSPDGRELVYFSNPNGHFDLFRKPLSGGRQELLLATDENKYPNDWSADGRYLLFGSLGANTNSDIWVLPMKGERTSTTYVQTVATEGYAAFSPDSRWVAYQSDETGKAEVYVEPFPRVQGQGRRYQISNDGGGLPKWREDGRELFYVTAAGKMMVVSVTAGAGFTTSAPHLLFQTRALPRTWNLFDINRAGTRFLVNTPLEWASSSPITVVANWTAGFKAD